MLMLAFVFQNLAIRKPDLDSGVFIYARAGFGDYAGFNSAIGFWARSIAGNTFYWVFIGATLGAFFDGFGDGDTVLAVALATVGVWTFHYLIARGVRDGAVINRIVTVFKIIPADDGAARTRLPALRQGPQRERPAALHAGRDRPVRPRRRRWCHRSHRALDRSNIPVKGMTT
jgi:hypothetical protein